MGNGGQQALPLGRRIDDNRRGRDWRGLGSQRSRRPVERVGGKHGQDGYQRGRANAEKQGAVVGDHCVRADRRGSRDALRARQVGQAQADRLIRGQVKRFEAVPLLLGHCLRSQTLQAGRDRGPIDHQGVEPIDRIGYAVGKLRVGAFIGQQIAQQNLGAAGQQGLRVYQALRCADKAPADLTAVHHYRCGALRQVEAEYRVLARRNFLAAYVDAVTVVVDAVQLADQQRALVRVDKPLRQVDPNLARRGAGLVNGQRRRKLALAGREGNDFAAKGVVAVDCADQIDVLRARGQVLEDEHAIGAGLHVLGRQRLEVLEGVECHRSCDRLACGAVADLPAQASRASQHGRCGYRLDGEAARDLYGRPYLRLGQGIGEAGHCALALAGDSVPIGQGAAGRETGIGQVRHGQTVGHGLRASACAVSPVTGRALLVPDRLALRQLGLAGLQEERIGHHVPNLLVAQPVLPGRHVRGHASFFDDLEPAGRRGQAGDGRIGQGGRALRQLGRGRAVAQTGGAVTRRAVLRVQRLAAEHEGRERRVLLIRSSRCQAGLLYAQKHRQKRKGSADQEQTRAMRSAVRRAVR